MEHVPFTFHRTCSCCVGNSVPGLHAAIYLGRSFGSNGDYAICDAVPSTGMTPQAANRMLAGVVGSLLPVPWELAASDSDQNRPVGRVRQTVRHCAHSAHEPRCLPAPAQWVPDSSPDGPLPKSPETAAAFPTDSKERERDAKNLRKAQGLEAKEKKKKTFAVEDHYDDCGDDLSLRSAPTFSWSDAVRCTALTRTKNSSTTISTPTSTGPLPTQLTRLIPGQSPSHPWTAGRVREEIPGQSLPRRAPARRAVASAPGMTGTTTGSSGSAVTLTTKVSCPAA